MIVFFDRDFLQSLYCTYQVRKLIVFTTISALAKCLSWAMAERESAGEKASKLILGHLGH
jgi:hypothetical protein